MKRKIIKKIIKCAVCRKEVEVDEFYQGQCKNCGWNQDRTSINFPNKVIYPNYMSYNKALKLYSENKPLFPSFDDFVGMFKFYGEVEFRYKNKLYGLAWPNKIIELFDGEPPYVVLSTYKDYEDFAENAHIDGKLLRDVWDEFVTNPDWLN